MKKRIWELDAFRGLCILGMVVVHLVYDLVDLFQVVDWEYPELFRLVMDWGGVLFLLLSGISVTLGSHPIRRGLVVILCGMVCTAVTWGMYALGFTDKSIIIYFGVLHCLGCCMLLWPVFKKMPAWLLALTGMALAALGLFLFGNITGSTPWLIPLGIVTPTFSSSDYFPLLPNLGYFLMGAGLGKSVYRNQESLLPGSLENSPPARFLCWCGRKSLFIYMLHQPILSGAVYLIGLL